MTFSGCSLSVAVLTSILVTRALTSCRRAADGKCADDETVKKKEADEVEVLRVTLSTPLHKFKFSEQGCPPYLACNVSHDCPIGHFCAVSCWQGICETKAHVCQPCCPECQFDTDVVDTASDCRKVCHGYSSYWASCQPFHAAPIQAAAGYDPTSCNTTRKQSCNRRRGPSQRGLVRSTPAPEK
eukprot:gnl/TRDRNA2_/TRDRNA2_39156_c0_seq2.p1 gnl/TRDRNA2_/TRDRNA2_39156_c0~~gnl/TRDRNA2_/TRDRNA2_39156_c0_seq2.p1  ORF type:complete len:184 (+),score=13.76 gnl/TRDRNA2_/TRDRNA2_39156_c0_seq2:47-598(+)